jgi:cytochrome c peroxidase
MEQRSFVTGADRPPRRPANHQPPTTNRPLWLLLLLTVGCQPATPYQTVKPVVPAPPAPKSAPEEINSVGWFSLPPMVQPDVSLEFVTETNLPRFWNPPPTAEEKAAVAAALSLFPGTVSPLAATPDMVRIKVPAGLDDPRPFLPSDSDDNPPTLNKWRLGRDLFYDKSWLVEGGGESCASCHKPQAGFADAARVYGDFNTPTLVNCVFNRRQFWDGRVQSLEEVVQRTVADETAPPDQQPFRHVWSGVVRRLRASTVYPQRFTRVFGGEPTEDAVGKALATYLRTLLAADSIHDRAVAAQKADKADQLKAKHYETALDDAALKRLGVDKEPKADVAQKIYRGYRLFNDLEEHKTGCILCHSGPEFTDGKFHNIGVDFTWAESAEPGKEPGRFASLPLGRKDPRMIGAYKTPTLRGLPRTGPYFHDGSAATLEEAVRFHTDGGRLNAYLDHDLLPRDVPSEEFADLVLFLRALEGAEVDPAVGPAPP